MPSPDKPPAPTIVTALLMNETVRVTHTMRDGVALIEEILSLEHTNQESSLWVGDVEYHSSGDGPYPNHLMRVSARPSIGCAALSYTDQEDPASTVVHSFNSGQDLPETFLIYNGNTGAVFPHWAAIPVTHARNALLEWLRTRSLPTCINWRPHNHKET